MKKIIRTAGPSISNLEIKYVTDAVKTGWNDKSYDYMRRFEKKFAEYIGVKYARVTSGGTGALWLSLAALGIGKGDEVIIPEITYFACSDVVKLLGATPVFVDVLSDTWCIDPKQIEKAITKKTKAIMPVYIYGNAVEADEIMKIAKKYKLYVVEDACPAIGTLYKKKHAGTFGDFGAFSFQGAKIMVAGFGGMIVTDNKKLFEKALYLNNHGEEPGKKFWQTSIGYSFEMPNISCALALAQLERIESFVVKKRKIFNWYKKRLSNIDGISLNVERPGTRCTYWMSSIILDKNFGISRDEFCKKLLEKGIDTRPIFYPSSMFPMYKEQKTPVAHHIGLNGINLPSGLNLTEKEVDYICAKVKNILKVS